MNLELKVYDIDYSTIIRNYLNPLLWEKIYNVFHYRNYLFTMYLDNIYCQDKKLCLKYSINYKGNNYSTYVWVYLNSLNMKVLQKQVNGALFELVEEIEKVDITNMDEYKRIKNGASIEQQILKDIANEFLDSNGVSNKDIRKSYVSDYISNNTKTSRLLSHFINDKKYTVMTDLYLTLTKAMGDTSRYNTILQTVGKDTTIIDFNEIMESIENGQYEEEMRGELDEI